MKRTKTRQIKVGNILIGGQNKVVIQSMCNTKTIDVDNTVKQILELKIVQIYGRRKISEKCAVHRLFDRFFTDGHSRLIYYN